jgi:peptidoglycan/LPS O-acetylase OafA/YrhL
MPSPTFGLSSARPMPYVSYAVKRVFRIYPAFLIVILASYCLHYFIASGALSLIVADFTAKTIEFPFIKLGKRLAAKTEPAFA